MDAEKIVQDLTRRFSAPLPEFYNRRIVFWHDEDQKFESQIDELELNDVTIIKLTGSNQFAVKKLLTIDDTTSNYLVYCPISYDSPEKNWLINIELYSGEPFRADIYTAWMDEIGLVQNPNYRELIKRYSKSLVPFWEKSITKDNAKGIADNYRHLCEKRITETDVAIFDSLLLITPQDTSIKDKIDNAIKITKLFMSSIVSDSTWFMNSDQLKSAFNHLNDIKKYVQMQLLSSKNQIIEIII